MILATPTRRLTAAIGLSTLLALSSCSTSGVSSTAEARIDGAKVTLDTDACPTSATKSLGEGADIVIGSSLALSGPVSASSHDLVPGVRAVVDKVNAEGGIDGHKIKLIVKDDAYEVARAVTNVKGLLDVDNAMATIFQLGTAQGLAVQSLHESLCAPQLAVSSGAPQLSNPAEHPYSTSNFLPYSAYGRMQADFLAARYPDGARVGELIWNTDFGATSSGAFEKALKDTPTTIIAKAQHDSSTVSLTNQVTQLLAERPDVLIAHTGSGYCTQFVTLSRRAGFDGPILLPYACSDAGDVLGPVGDQAHNVFAGQSFMDPSSQEYADNPAAQEYLETMRTFAPDAKVKASFTITGYQMASVLVEQLRRAADTDLGLSRAGLMNAVWSTDTETGLTFPGHPTIIDGESPYSTSYARMAEYRPATQTWEGTNIDVSTVAR
ncbi:UNVERIFIED_ORG: ABC-type branched-subunit amino acid transport system substrate-binding protein [Rhodococcus erythropolis]